LSLNAALVPEPRWTAIVPAIVFVACCLAARKRRAQRFLAEMPGASRGCPCMGRSHATTAMLQAS
jgi:hypothetical protein